MEQAVQTSLRSYPTRQTARFFEGQSPHPHLVVYGLESPIPASWCLWIVPGTSEVACEESDEDMFREVDEP